MHISLIESGRVAPRLDTLLDLIRVLGLDLVLVPREVVATVQALVRERDAEEDQPLYGDLRDEDDDS